MAECTTCSRSKDIDRLESTVQTHEQVISGPDGVFVALAKTKQMLTALLWLNGVTFASLIGTLITMAAR